MCRMKAGVSSLWSPLRVVIASSLLLITLLLKSVAAHEQADLIVFSFDRPMQLYAFLESLKEHVSPLGRITVIVRVSNRQFSRAYWQVFSEFPQVKFMWQTTGTANNFRKLVQIALNESQSKYIMFGVDDLIVKDTVDIRRCIKALEKYNAYGFYLRMGVHLTYCYPMSCEQKVPPYNYLEDDICAWTFAEGEYDWHYPNMLDMTLYRKIDVKQVLNKLRYNCPNSLEGAWGSCADFTKRGLFFDKSKVVNVPINRVQKFSNLLHMNLYSPEELLKKFVAGLKIDISPLKQIVNKSGHMEWQPVFIERKVS